MTGQPIIDPQRLLPSVTPRMGTLKEFFDLNTFCGDFQSTGQPVRSAYNLDAMYHERGCGARDWRVIRPNLFARNESIIICQKCGLHYAVERREATP